MENLNTIKNNPSVSKNREREINELYSIGFQERVFPNTDEYEVYDKMRMVNVYDLIKEGIVQEKKS